MTRDFVVSADSHLIEPPDLFRTRLPEHLRDRGVWEENFEVEPLVEGGVREFMHWHTAGYEGWTISRYRHHDGSLNTGEPERILEDMDWDGIDATLIHPQYSLFAIFSDDHELSMATARVYNDYLIERILPFKSRIRPTCPIPITDIDDAVAEIERVANAGLGALLLPATPHVPYFSRELDPVWAGGAGRRVADLLPHLDRWREGQRARVADARRRVSHERDVQRADDRRAGRRADDVAIAVQPDGAGQDHHRAHRRRCAGALSRPALRSRRVRRLLVGAR